MTKFIYYKINEGWHCGEEAMKLHYIPNADELSSRELFDLGWEKREIPDGWEPHCRYINGQLIVRPDAPPYWDELGMALRTNSLFQRLQPLRFAISDVDTAMGLISDVVGIGRDQQSLGFTIATLLSILEQVGQSITPQEIVETEALLVSCGFYPDFFTYARNVATPPPPPM